MNIAEALKIKAAAKAYLGGAAIAAQVALDYLPDHDNGYYKAVQGLVAVLSIIGIYAVPNKVAEAKDAVDGAVGQVTNVFHAAAPPAAAVPPVDPAPVTETPAPAAEPAPADAAAPADPAVATPIQKDTPTP